MTGDEGRETRVSFAPTLVRESWFSLRITQASQRSSFEIVTLHPLGWSSTIQNPFAFLQSKRLSVALLHTSSSHCSVFKVQAPASLRPDLKIQLPLGLQIHLQWLLVGLSGLEPPTLRLSVVRSSQLSSRPSSELTSLTPLPCPACGFPRKLHFASLLLLFKSQTLRWFVI